MRELITHTDRRQRSNFAWLLALICLFAAAKPILWDNLDPDFFWHLRVAEQIEQQGPVPIVDEMSFNSIKAPWTPYSWLAELGMKWWWDSFGLPGVLIAQAILQATFLAFIALSCLEASRYISNRPRYLTAILCTTFAGLFSLAYLSFRPVMFVLVLMSICAWLIWRDRNRPTRALWYIAPITALSANLHLYVILLVAWVWAIALGSYIDGRRDRSKRPIARRYARLAIVTAISSCLTPMLFGAIEQAISYQSIDKLVASKFIDEMRPTFLDFRLGSMLAIVALTCVVVTFRRRNLIGFWAFCWIGVSLLMYFRMGRLAPVFAICAMPLLTVALTGISDSVLSRPLLRPVLTGVVALAFVRVLISIPGDHQLDRFVVRHGPDAPVYPSQAARYIEANLSPTTGRLINEFNWGGYLAWRLGDRYQVFMDGRTQLYTADFWQRTCLGDSFASRDLILNARADLAVLPIRKSRFAPVIESLGWREVYRDDVAQIWIAPELNATAQ